MAFRKLSRGGPGEDCGAESMISGGVADPLGQKEDDEEQKCASPSRRRLEQASGEVIAALHAAKQELAQEMESNLKQLKAVLQETQRIAKEMEAVLKEARAEPDPQEEARGDAGGGGGKQKKQQRQNPQEESWHPPDFKMQCDDDDETPAWKPPQLDDDEEQEQHAH